MAERTDPTRTTGTYNPTTPTEPGKTEGAREKGTEEQIRKAGQQAGEKAAQYYEQGRERATQYYEGGREMVQEWQQDLEQYIRRKPLESLLIAGGVGLFLGVLLRR